MVKSTLKFTSSKIKEISHPTENVGKRLFDEMHPIYNELKSSKINPELETALKNYFIIRLVTFVEDHFKDIVSHFIDNNKIDIYKIIGTDVVSLPLSKLSEIKKEDVTKGKIIAGNFNFLNPRVIDDVVSDIIETRFFILIKKVAKEHKISMLDPHHHHDDMKRKESDLVKNWNNFIAIFSLRNQIVHSTTKNMTKNIDELWLIYENVLTFLSTAEFIINLEKVWLANKKYIEKDMKSGKTTFKIGENEVNYADWFPKVSKIIKK